MRTNYHTHTPHCGHALGNHTSEYAKAAFDADIKILGFTDHAPFQDKDFGCRMQYDELQIYFSEVDVLQKEYEGRMKILKSVEIEYLPEYDRNNSYYEWLLKDQKLDYLLLGQHFFRDRKNDLYNLYNIPGPDIIHDYALACAKAMETGYFKIFAHPDLFGVNPFLWTSIYDKATSIIVESAVKNNVILELNANGYRRQKIQCEDGERYMYPLEKFWNEVAKSKAKVIVSSDTHNPLEIWDHAMDLAYEYLHSIGITPIESLD